MVIVKESIFHFNLFLQNSYLICIHIFNYVTCNDVILAALKISFIQYYTIKVYVFLHVIVYMFVCVCVYLYVTLKK